MNEIIYLDPDEEITSVIDKLKKSPSAMVSLAIPRGANLSQSIINLKLLKKSAEENDKEISLVSNDRVSRNLASQLGMTVFSKVSEAEKATSTSKKETPVSKVIPEGFSNIKVNSYYKNKDDEAEDTEDEEIDEPEEEKDEELEEVKAELKNRPEPDDKDYNDDENDDKEKEEKSKPLPEKDDYQPMKNRNAGGQNYNMKKTKKILIGIIVAVLIIVFALAYLFLPYASASVKVASTNYSVEKAVTVDPNLKSIDQNKLSIPGTVESVEKDITQTFKSTGQQKTPTASAGGTITIYNTWSGDPIAFAQGTKFTSNGLNFLSTKAATVPGGTTSLVNGKVTTTPGTVDVPVQAENQGDNYNIGPSTFTIGGISSIQQPSTYGKSSAAMTGGVTQTANMVTDKDLQNAQTTLEKSAADQAKPDLITKINNDKLKYYDETISSQTISTSSTKNANDVADSFDYTVKINLNVTAFSADQLKTLVEKSAEDSLPTDKMLVGEDNAKITDSLAQNNATTGILDITGSFAGKIGQKIAAADIQNLIKNKSISSAENLIEQNSAVTSATVTIWPKFINRIPFLKSRIRVTFDYAN